MIHYTCDCCGRQLDTDSELRYVVRMEVYASLDPAEDALDDDRDHLQDLQDILERADDAQCDQIGDDVYQQVRYDLCDDCRKKFLRSPFGRLATQPLGFSKN
jgi:hypothetical protein